jgi:hypothetical protein
MRTALQSSRVRLAAAEVQRVDVAIDVDPINIL